MRENNELSEEERRWDEEAEWEKRENEKGMLIFQSLPDIRTLPSISQEKPNFGIPEDAIIYLSSGERRYAYTPKSEHDQQYTKDGFVIFLEGDYLHKRPVENVRVAHEDMPPSPEDPDPLLAVLGKNEIPLSVIEKHRMGDVIEFCELECLARSPLSNINGLFSVNWVTDGVKKDTRITKSSAVTEYNNPEYTKVTGTIAGATWAIELVRQVLRSRSPSDQKIKRVIVFDHCDPIKLNAALKALSTKKVVLHFTGHMPSFEEATDR